MNFLYRIGLWFLLKMGFEAGESIEQLLADYFGIDLNKVEAERRRLLDDLQASNEWDQAAEGATDG